MMTPAQKNQDLIDYAYENWYEDDYITFAGFGYNASYGTAMEEFLFWMTEGEWDA